MAQRKLLVADDSLTIQKVIRLALGNEGYDIQTVSDGAQALEQIATFRPDIVLIDVSLAKKSAFEVKSEINTHPDLAHVKFVLMSSAFKQVDEAQASSAGFDARLIKPFDPAHLRSVITTALGSSTTSPSPDSSNKRNEVGFSDFLSHLNNPPPGEFGADPIPLSDSNDSDTETTPTTSAISPPEGMSDDLWKTDTSLTSTAVEPEDDIRKLTESTLKMSGFADESGWSVQEKKAPSSFQSTDDHWQTHAPMSDSSHDLGFQFVMPSAQAVKGDPMLEPHKQHFEFDSSWTDSQHASERSMSAEPVKELKTTHAHTSGATAGSTSGGVSIDQGHLEQIIQKEVAHALEKVLKNMLPDIAERVIKDEIHKMLSNPPKG